MKTRIKRISRRTVSMVLAVLLMLSILGIGSLITASAMALNSGHIYFDATALIAANPDWGSHRLNIVYNYNNDKATYKPMTSISNTNLYYIQGSTTNYDNTSYLAFFSGDWNVNGENDQTWSNIYKNCLDITQKYTATYNFNNANGVYYITATAGTGSKARVVSAPTYLGESTNAATRYGYLNKTLTVKTALYNGSTYDDASSTKYGTFTASGYKLNGANTSTSSSISQTNGTGTITTARSTTVSVTQEPEDGYEFVGWKAGSIDSSGSDLSNSYSFSNTGSNATVYAYYRRDSSPSIDSFTTNHATLNLGEEATLSSTYTNAPNGVTYSIKSGSESKVSLDSDTVTAIAPGTATLVATLVDDPTETRELNIDVNTPTITTFRYGASGSTDGTSNTKNHPIYVGTTSVAPTMAVSNTNAGADVTYAYTIGNATYGSVGAATGVITANSTPNASQTVTATATITYNGVTFITASKTAYYKVYAYYLLGFRNKVDNPWTKNAANMMTPDTDSGWLTINRTLSGGTTTYGSGSNNDNDTGFKVAYYDGSTTTYYSNSGTVTATITKETINSNNGTWVYASNVNNNARLTTKNCSTDDAVYKFYFKESTKQLAVYYPLKITYDKNGGNTTQYEAVPYGEHANLPAANPTRTGYTFTTWTTTANGNTTFDFTSARTADATAYAKWSEDTVDVTIKAFTGGSESTTGGTVLPTSVNVGIDTSASSVATADAASGYIFNGWQVVGSHINLYTDAECNTPYVAGDRTHTTIYIKTDGNTDITSATAIVRALFVNGARTYVVGTMVKDDTGNYTTAKAADVANTGDDFTATTTGGGAVVMYSTALMSTTGDISATDRQNPTVNFTGATDNGGSYEFTYVKYKFVGWKKSDTPITEVSGDNTSWDETDASINPTVPASGEGYWYACYRKQYVFCAFRSYNYSAGTSGQIIFIASPPTKYKIGDNAATGYTEQGAKFAVPAGDTLELTYSSLASSDCIDHVYYDDTNYTTATPSAENFNSSNQHEITSGMTVDQSAHKVYLQMTQNYKNIHISLGTKYKVFFSDEKNAIIHSKNVDNYYAPGEDMSGTTEAKYLTVKAAGNASQTNSIVSANVKFYYCNSTGEYTDASGNLVDTPVEITSTDLAFEAGDSTNSGATDGTARKITGTMPNTNVYVDLGLATTYDFYLGSYMVSDTSSNHFQAWNQVADTKVKYTPDSTELVTSVNTYNNTKPKITWNSTGTPITDKANISSGDITAVKKGDTVTLTWDYWNETYAGQYMFLGWYKGDSTGPDYSKKGFLSEKKTFPYKPKSNVYVYAVGTRDMFINGTMSITGADTEVGDWPSENFKMSFDPDYVNPDGGARGRYYWEITEEMLNATSDPGKLTALYDSSNGIWLQSGLYNKSSDGEGSTTRPWNRAAANSWFRIYDSATNSGVTNTSGLSYWAGIDDQENNKKDSNSTPVLQWGKANTGDVANDTEKQTLGLGFINYNPTTYPAYSAPIRIYAYPGKGIDVEATPIYSNIYVSNGFTVGSTSKDTAVTVTPAGGDSFTITSGETFTGSNEGTVTKFIPKQKNATVRITKPCASGDKVSSFLIYDLDKDKGENVKSITDVKNDGDNYYIDLTLKLKQNLYIVPTIEAAGSNVTVFFDSTQLNKEQWGDIVTCYAWYTNNQGNALGDYPGQPMIVSDDLGSWKAKFPSTKTVSGTKYNIAGILFSNYVDGNQSWLGRVGNSGTKVMSTITYTDATNENPAKVTNDNNGLIKTYNKIISGTTKNGVNFNEYSRENFKAQTYDYREPIAIFNNEDPDAVGVETTITFAMKDGNTSLISWRHEDLTDQNLLNNDWNVKFNWEYLTNSTGNKYADLNGTPMDIKPTATYYIAAKGGALYNNGEMTSLFYSGKSYDTKDHNYTFINNAYNVDYKASEEATALGGWGTAVNYGNSSTTTANPNDVDFDYAVQWYVYDAEGNYITTCLSAGYADKDKEKTMSYISKDLTEKGYAVDGKAVAICYDKPRYYYYDSNNIANGAPSYTANKKINSGTGFAGYRFTGQWYSTVKTEPVTVNVRVGMMTESGEIVSDSNVAGYGSASAVYSTQNGTAAYSVSYDGDKSVTIARADAEKRLVKLDASNTNFIGWYYYDTNTGEFVKASYESNSNFFPNFTKGVTYYAMYKAAATYKYKYQGREIGENGTKDKYYSVSGGDLTEAEMTAGNKISLERTDFATKAPIDKISVFKRRLDFSKAMDGSTGSIVKNNDEDYVMKLSNFLDIQPTYTLTAHYVDSAGANQTMAVNAVYNGQAVELLDNSGVPIGKQWTGHKFVGWYSYDTSKEGAARYGELLSAHPKYGLRLTGDQDIIAVYENDGSRKTLPTVADVWHAYIDENTVTKEMYGANSGRYYNDTIVRVRNDLDVNTPLPEGAEVGVVMINDNGTGDPTNVFSADNIKTVIKNVASGKTVKISGRRLSATKVSTTRVTSFNRSDVAIRGEYAKMKGSAYTIYSYIKISDDNIVLSSSKSGSYTA